MTYAPPPPPPPAGPPAQGGGFYYGPPPQAGAPAPHPAKANSSAIIAVFIGALIGVVVLVGIIVLTNQPKPPESCEQGVICPPNPPPPSTGPRMTLPPGQTLPPLTTPAPTAPGQTPAPTSTPGAVATPAPTPISNAAPYFAGTVWRSETLGYSFEYDPQVWSITQEDSAYTRLVLNSSRFDMVVHVVGFDGSVSVDSALQSIYEQTDTFVIGRATDTRPYDALLGPSIGYLRGEGSVFVGTYKDSDGNPSDPVGITITGATNGKATVVIIVLVANPDDTLNGQTAQHELRHLADNLLKTFLWGQ